MTDLRNYFMKPKQMKNGLELYPIKIMDYEEFKILAAKYIVMDILQLNNQRKQEKLPLLEQENLFDYLTALASDNYDFRHSIYSLEDMKKTNSKKYNDIINKEETIKSLMNNKSLIKQLKENDYEKGICRLFEMVLHKKVIYNNMFKNFDVVDEDDKLIAIINSHNFVELREIVMDQNVLFEPIVAPTKKAQKYIDASMNKGDGSESDMEAIIAFVCTNSSVGDISNYTYYRLIADFRSLIKQLNRNDVVAYSVGGATKKNGKPLDVPNVIENLGVNHNPYDDVFNVHERNENGK